MKKNEEKWRKKKKWEWKRDRRVWKEKEEKSSQCMVGPARMLTEKIGMRNPTWDKKSLKENAQEV